MTQLVPLRNEQISGNAMIELALILPVLCLLVFVGIDIIRALNTYQTALTLSRNIATTAYRHCVIDMNLRRVTATLKTVDYDSSFKPQKCLEGVRDSFLTTVSLIAPNSDFVLSMYHMDDANQQAAAAASAAAPTPTPTPVPTPTLVATLDAQVGIQNGVVFSETTGPQKGRYTLADHFSQTSGFDADYSGNTTKALNDYEVLIVSEVFVPYHAYFKGIMNLLNFDGDKIYAATLY